MNRKDLKIILFYVTVFCMVFSIFATAGGAYTVSFVVQLFAAGDAIGVLIIELMEMKNGQ